MSVRSGPPRELPRLCGYLDCFTFFNEEGNPDLDASLQLRWLGHTATCGVATGAGFGVCDIQLHMGWQLQPDGVAIVLMQLDDGSFHDKVQSVSDHLVGKGEGLEARSEERRVGKECRSRLSP